MKIKLLLLLILLGLFFAVPQASAIVTPYYSQHCADGQVAAGGATTLACDLKSTHTGTGWMILVAFNGTYNTSTLTTTETLTCPGPATIAHNFGFGNWTTTVCYVAPASTHATFSTSVTVSGTYTVELLVFEVYGVGAEDTAATTGNANGTSVSITTTAANEYIFGFGTDYATGANAGSGFSQLVMADGGDSVQAGTILIEDKFAATATTYTTAFTPISSFPRAQIVAIAFAAAGSVPPPTPLIVQACSFTNQDGGGAACSLTNTAAGNKLLIASSVNNSSTIGVAAGAAGETVNCPANSQTTAGSPQGAVCYIDFSSSHATYQLSMGGFSPAFTGPSAYYEVSGLTSGVDAGSEANTTTQTLSYTTANANEYTFIAGFDAITSATAPNGGNIPQTTYQRDPGNTWQGIMLQGITTASGSNSQSMTSANTFPRMVGMSFGVAAAPITGFPMVVEKLDLKWMLSVGR